MKKILSVILLLSLCVCFAGCGSSSVRGEVINDNLDEAKPEFSSGIADSSTYNNDFLGISCTFPEGWVFYSDDQILELNNITGEYMDEETAELLKNAPIIYDMYAQNYAEGSSVNVNLEKLNIVQIANLDIKETLEAQIPAVESTYENMGYTDINVEYQKIKVDGKDFDGIALSANIQGLDFSAVVFAFRKSNYLTNVTVAALQADKIEEILGCFTIK